MKEDLKPQIFDAEALGMSFRQLAVDIVRGESTDFVSRWFRSAQSDADLVIWMDSHNRIIKHQLCFFGQIVEWNAIHGTRTGLVVEEEVLEISSEGAASFDSDRECNVSETIVFDQRAQMKVVAQAIRVLSTIPEINEEDRDLLVYNLRESPKMHKNARERALKVWAPKSEELTSTRRPAFWKRLRKWVLGD